MSTSSLIQYISLGSVLFGMVMLPGRVSLFQMRKEAWLKPLQSVIMLVSFTVPTILLLTASGGMVNYTLGAGFLGLGLIIGLIIGLRLKLRSASGGVRGKRSRFPTFMWGLPGLVTPLLARTGSPALYALGLMGVLFGLGLVVGSEGILFFRTLIQGRQARKLALASPPAYGYTPATGLVCPYPDCGRPLRPGQKFCSTCGRSVAQAAPAQAPQAPYQQPVAPAYQQSAAPAYQQPAPPAYQQPVQPPYQQQQPVRPAYQQLVQPAYQQPAQPTYQQQRPVAPAYQPPAPPQGAAATLVSHPPAPSQGSIPTLVSQPLPQAWLLGGRGTADMPPVHVSAAGLVIGRDASCGLVLRDAHASRQHAQVLFSSGGWFIRDLGSANGTCVNGVMVQQQALNPGDRIQIGDTEFLFQVG